MSTPGYASAYPDSRISGRIALQSFGPSTPTSSASLPTDLLLSLLLSKSILALSLYIAGEWLLAQGFGAFGLSACVLVAGGVVLAAWERVWEAPRGGKRKENAAKPAYAVLYALEVILYLLALSKISVLRHIMLTSFSTLWTRGVPISFLSSAGGKRASGKNNAVFMTCGMVGVSFLLDSLVSSQVSFLGYAYILLNLLVCGQRMDMLNAHTGDASSRGKVHAMGVMGASIVASVFAGLEWLIFGVNLVAGQSRENGFTLPAPTLSIYIPSAILVALSLLVVEPLLSRSLLIHFPAMRQVSAGWPLSAGSAIFVGYVGFGSGTTVAEAAVGLVAWTAISHLISSDPRSSMASSSSSSADFATSSSSKVPVVARFSNFYRHLRAVIKTILATRDSRQIYFFLCLNLAYMVVQMVYGILTNSLGLISDSIHMFFDCLALGMGLFASVMATWQPNDKFTYGYSRVETLSGFANGLFLCLISIFIVFEAIQRLLDPPEMNTSQLLVVSSVGLAVNLVGMYATGGHHHHGHSHGGHDHGHSHAPKKVKVDVPFPNAVTQDSSHHDGHAHSNGHDHAGHNHAGHEHAGHSHAGHNHASHDHSSHDHSSHSHSSHDHASHNHSSQDHSSHDHSSSHAGHDHSSHAGHDHDDEDDDHAHHSHDGHSHNMKGVFLHVMADTLGSVGVIISTLLINRYGWTGFDPLASIFIAVLIFASVVPLVVDSGKLLVLDMGEEREVEVKEALAKLRNVEGLSSYSSARFWSKDPSTMIGSISIQLAPSPSSHDPTRPEASLRVHHYANVDRVTARVRKVLKGGISGLEELTIQVEGAA